MITREDFLKFQVVSFPKYEAVDVPSLGAVWVKKLRAGEQDKFETENTRAAAADFRARLVAATCITEQGANMFSDEDISSLTLFDVETLDPIVEAALRMNPSFSKEYRDSLKKSSNGQAESSSAS